LPAGAAITITASEVYLDLNGKTLSSTLGTSFNIGVLVFNQVDVTIQEGDIDGFGYAGVYLAPNTTDNNKKNVIRQCPLQQRHIWCSLGERSIELGEELHH
jgi:hypothetical protein